MPKNFFDHFYIYLPAYSILHSDSSRVEIIRANWSQLVADSIWYPPQLEVNVFSKLNNDLAIGFEFDGAVQSKNRELVPNVVSGDRIRLKII